MIVDCHVHLSAMCGAHGSMSPRMLNSLPFRFMRWRFGIWGTDEQAERAIEGTLARTIQETPEIDAAVVLAFDAVYDRDGQLDPARTHLHVANDYVMDVARRNPKMLFGASVHPYRKDAVAELERCISAGAVLLKWLPVVQAFNPTDEKCIPVYETLVHYGLPLLCHTGWEGTLPVLDGAMADPLLLEPALKRGVTVIGAHCGTRGMPWQGGYLAQFIRLAREYERFYGDTAALNLPARWYAWRRLLEDEQIRRKLVHGSDWPIMPLPPPARLGWGPAWRLMGERNWMRRDVLIKQKMGLDEAYWQRAGKILRLKREAEVPREGEAPVVP